MKKDIKLRKYKPKKTKLTALQRKVFNYLIKDRLTISQIINIWDKPVSYNGIYKHYLALQRKGYITKDFISKVSKIDKDLPKDEEYRLHGQNMSIKIINITNKYRELIKNKDNTKYLENNTIKLYRDRIVLYSNTDFWADTVDKCLIQSNKYWHNFIKRIENELDIILIKKDNCKINEFRAHIEKVNDPLAKEIILSKQEVKIFGDDGELRMIFDNSFKPSFEAIHKTKAVRDMKKVERLYNDAIENEWKTLSELTIDDIDNQRQLKILTKQVNIIAESHNQLIELLKPKQIKEPKKQTKYTGNSFMFS